MALVVITDSGVVNDEWDTIKDLFEAGLTRLHIRKPEWDLRQLETWLEGIDESYHPYLAVHGSGSFGERHALGGLHLKGNQPVEGYLKWKGRLSKSFHEWSELDEKVNERLDYAFISPVFDSLSKVNYPARWSEKELKMNLKKRALPFRLLALGGVCLETLNLAKSWGFDGAAILGSVWKYDNRKDRVNAFKEMVKTWQEVY
ncbi:MAG: thiamine phosphate synthase [Bacteroidota bacterium]